MMDRRELLKRLGLAGLALPAAVLVDQVRVPELVPARDVDTTYAPLLTASRLTAHNLGR